MPEGAIQPRAGIRNPHQWRLWFSGLLGSRYDGLTHFSVVTPGVLMRCGQPRVSDLEKIRTEHKLRTIVCVRGGTRHPLRGRWFRRERAYCVEHGIHLEHMPFSDAATPPPDVFERFLSIVRDADRHPVLVHCEQGFHRTGVLCAAYRVRVEEWPVERAVQELSNGGFEIGRKKRRPLLDAFLEWANWPSRDG